MIAPVSHSSTPTVDPRLGKAAQEFEAMLLADLLKMSHAEGESEGDADQSLHGYDDLRNQAVATALAHDGGIGIARILITKLATGGDIKGFSSPADSSIAGTFRGGIGK